MLNLEKILGFTRRAFAIGAVALASEFGYIERADAASIHSGFQVSDSAVTNGQTFYVDVWFSSDSTKLKALKSTILIGNGGSDTNAVKEMEADIFTNNSTFATAGYFNTLQLFNPTVNQSPTSTGRITEDVGLNDSSDSLATSNYVARYVFQASTNGLTIPRTINFSNVLTQATDSANVIYRSTTGGVAHDLFSNARVTIIPPQPTPTPRITNIEYVPSNSTVNLSTLLTPGYTTDVQYVNDLISGTWSNVASEFVSYTGNVNNVSQVFSNLPTSEDKSFYRLHYDN